MTCEKCITGSIHEGTPTGREIKIASLPIYEAGEAGSDRIILMGADIFGWKFNNNRLLADEYAKHGFRVIMPDFFGGFELPIWTLDTHDPVNETPSLLQRFVLKPFSMFVMVPWLLRNYNTQVSQITAVAKALRESNPTAKIGYVGFCWGGRYSFTLSSLFDATAACHPSLVEFPGELDLIKAPFTLVAAETDDKYFNGNRARETEKFLQARKAGSSEVIVYKGVQHGFTTRGDMKDEGKKRARDQALSQVVTWFEKHLVPTPVSTTD